MCHSLAQSESTFRPVGFAMLVHFFGEGANNITFLLGSNWAWPWIPGSLDQGSMAMARRVMEPIQMKAVWIPSIWP